VTVNLGALLTILQHSPLLEKLTLQLNEVLKFELIFCRVNFFKNLVTNFVLLL
jgi:hypothetical protein